MCTVLCFHNVFRGAVWMWQFYVFVVVWWFFQDQGFSLCPFLNWYELSIELLGSVHRQYWQYDRMSRHWSGAQVKAQSGHEWTTSRASADIFWLLTKTCCNRMVELPILPTMWTIVVSFSPVVLVMVMLRSCPGLVWTRSCSAELRCGQGPGFPNTWVTLHSRGHITPSPPQHHSHHSYISISISQHSTQRWKF